MSGRRIRITTRLAYICAIALASATSGCATTISGSAKKFGTMDIGALSVRCQPFTFITSLNDDDDNQDRQVDRRGAIAAAFEDNLRRFDFDHPGASEVYVAAPVRVPDQTPVLNVRVRAYQADKSTPFDFTRNHAVPVTMYLEGIQTSSRREDIGFEYNYFLANGQTLCGDAPTGTIMEVRARFRTRGGGGAPFDRHRKMLIGGRGEGNASVEPATIGTTTWSYDGDATLATPDQLVTGFRAGLTFTPPVLIDGHRLRFEVDEGGQRIRASHPVNLTAAQHLSANRSGFQYTSPWYNANRGRFTLIPTRRIRYTILDQARRPIRESAYAGRKPQIRENIGNVLTSPIPAVMAWIRNDLNWTRDWKDKTGGRFTDRIQALDISKDPFTQSVAGRVSFHPSLQVVGGVLMQVMPPATHEWQLSINGDAIAVGTRNPFSSVVNATRQGQGVEIQVRSTYRVVTP